MAQIKTGTISVTNGSAVVTGLGTTWLTDGLAAGDILTVVNDAVWYSVATIDTDLQITLAANYAGVTGTGKTYAITKDFTANRSYPFPVKGDIETAVLLQRALQDIDLDMDSILTQLPTLVASDQGSGLAVNAAGDGYDLIDVHRKNLLINGGFDIWQRGTSFTDPDGEYTADRFLSDSVSGGTGNATITRQAFTLGQTDVPNNPKYFLRHLQSVAVSSVVPILIQRVEGVETLSGRNATVSFRARVASGTKTLAISLRQNFGTGGSPSGATATSGGTFVATTTWQRFTTTIAIPSISGKTLGSNGDDSLSLQIREESSFGTYTMEFANMQLESGDQETLFEVRAIAEELALCSRYFQRYSYTSGQRLGGGTTAPAAPYTSTNQALSITTPMRVAPTFSVSAASDFTLSEGVSSLSVSALTAGSTSENNVSMNITHASTSLRPAMLRAGNSNAKIFLAAEL